MSKYAVLLVDDDPQYRDFVYKYLSAQEKVQLVDIATDGRQALEKMRLKRYDALLMGLILPKLDGLGILENLRRIGGEQPAVIVVSAIRNESMIRYAFTLGARYYMAKPIEPETLYKRMLDMLTTAQPETSKSASPQPPKTLSEEITLIFLATGIPAHIKGYHYLREGIRMVFNNPELINHLTKELYPCIAKQFSTTSSKVERGIRHAIEVAWERGKIENINQFFDCKIYSKYDKPTNGEFIALVADRLLMKHGREMASFPEGVA